MNNFKNVVFNVVSWLFLLLWQLAYCAFRLMADLSPRDLYGFKYLPYSKLYYIQNYFFSDVSCKFLNIIYFFIEILNLIIVISAFRKNIINYSSSMYLTCIITYSVLSFNEAFDYPFIALLYLMMPIVSFLVHFFFC